MEIKKLEYIPLKRVRFNEPLNKTYFYRIEKTSTSNLLVLSILDLPYNEFDQLYICEHCYINLNIKCYRCVKFYQYSHTFLLETLFGYYRSPPPTFFSDRNFNFFKTFIKKTQEFLIKHNIKSFKNVTIPEYGSVLYSEWKNQQLNEEKRFETFLNNPFNNGVLKQQFSGKKSIIRNMMLGKIMPSMRYVLTIDTQLGPDEVSIPKLVYNKLNISSNFVIINRAPSINDTCISVAMLRWHTDSFTAKISAFIADGLHADQDGDEITIFMLPKTNDGANYNEFLMMKELRHNMWSIGIRHKFDYSPKISFGQYYLYVLYKFHDKIVEKFPLYGKLPCSVADKPKFLMNLFCGSQYDKAISFISDLMDMSKDLPIPIPSLTNILTGKLNDIIDSGSKGSINHLSEFIQLMKGLNEKEHHNKSIEAFNRYITSSGAMSKSGQQLYSMLFGTSSLILKSNSLTYMGHEICSDFYSKTSTFSVQYNNYDILLLKSFLLNDYEENIKKQKLENDLLQIKKQINTNVASSSSSSSNIIVNEFLKCENNDKIKYKTISYEHSQSLTEITENLNVKTIQSESII